MGDSAKQKASRQPAARWRVIREVDAGGERSLCGSRRDIVRAGEGRSPVAMHAVAVGGARSHYHKVTHEYYIVLRGRGCLRLDGVEVPVSAGDAIDVPPGVMHVAEPAEGSSLSVVIVAWRLPSLGGDADDAYSAGGDVYFPAAGSNDAATSER